MKNIFDYLEWRGDLSFEADPFNEVDNLILSELAYVDFRGLVYAERNAVPLETVRDRYFAMHPRKLIRPDGNHIVRAPLLMDAMMSGDRFASTQLAGHVDVLDTGDELQMAAVTFLLDDGTAFVAFRGTDMSIVGWKEDFNMSYQPVTEGQKRAAEYLGRIASAVDRPLRVGGHSKGGNFAVYASAFCDKAVRDRIIGVYTNDGPGFRKEITDTDEYREVLPKVTSIVPETSIIGMLLASGVKHRYIRSSGAGFAQHDALTWQVERNSFALAEQSGIGTFISRSQKDWLGKLADDERQAFVNNLFSLLEATGMATFDEISARKLKALESIRNSMKSMPKEQQREMNRVIGELLASGRDIALEGITTKRKK